MLRRAVVERRQIKIWTRSAVGFKATLVGTPLLFDKHMNLVRLRSPLPLPQFLQEFLSPIERRTGATWRA